MPHLKITRYDSTDNYKEIIVFDGEITEEHSKRINDFFDKIKKKKEELINRITERMNTPEFKSKIEKLRKEQENK